MKIQRNINWRILIVNNKMYLINVVTSEQLRLDSPKKETLYLFKCISGNDGKQVIIQKFRKKYPKVKSAWANEYINLLLKEKVITYKINPPKYLLPKYLLSLDRQLDFLSELNNKSNYENQSLLKNAKIAILGLGSVSHYTILSLLASGVGFFRCVDFDKVERRNIGRQPIFLTDDIGRYKSVVTAEYIKQTHCGTKVEAVTKMLSSEEDIRNVVKDCDIVVQSCDMPRFLIHRQITSVCLKLKKPNILLYSGRVGPFNIPYKTACYGCLEAAMKRKFILYDALVKDINEAEFTRFPELAIVGSISGILAAKEIIGHILKIRPQTYNGFFDIHPMQLKINLHHLPRQKKCELCGKK